MQNKILVVEKFYTEYFEVKYTNSKDILLGKKKKLCLILYKNATEIYTSAYTLSLHDALPISKYAMYNFLSRNYDI